MIFKIKLHNVLCPSMPLLRTACLENRRLMACKNSLRAMAIIDSIASYVN